jgi:nucleoid-associated protein YgaU
MGIIATPALSSGAPSSLDAAVSAVAPALATAVSCWIALALLTAAAVRLLGTRRVSGRALDRALGWLAPGVAGRLLRAVVGLGVTSGLGVTGLGVTGLGVTGLGVTGLGVTGTALVGAGFAVPTARAAVTPVHPSPPTDPGSTAPAAAAALVREARLVLATALPAAPPRHRQPTPELWPLSAPLRDRAGVGDGAGVGHGAGVGDGAGARDGDVVVQRGDSLWSIAARQLPAHVPDSRIEALWRRWYLRNRAVIGADPNLLLPGQVLRAPF